MASARGSTAPARTTALTAFTDKGALLAMSFAWATTWEHTADREFGPVLRMPPLPVVTFDFARAPGSKVPGILRFTAARPFIWIDDDVTDLDRDLLADSGTHHLVLEPDPHVGLTRVHLDQARAWTADLT